MPVSRTTLAATILASSTLFACGHAPPPPATAQAVRTATRSVLAVATRHDDGSMSLCSGTLVASNLVLTARHCVSNAFTATPACDAHGASHNGVHFGADADPADVGLYAGPHVDVGEDAPLAFAAKLIHPSTTILCDADVAFIVLDRPLHNVTVLPMRLERSIAEGEYVVPIGFGGGTTGDIGTRVERAPSQVLAVGPGRDGSTGAVLGPREFEVNEPTCKGDSGGPALDVATGEVVGVVSRGRSCWTEGNHVYTRVDAYARLARQALRAAREEAQVKVASRTTFYSATASP